MTATVASDVCIAVTFLTGRYHGEEWPPSPARLYQAMLAAVMTCGNQAYLTEVEPALRWLEQQAPPEIRACLPAKESTYRLAVPNNDMDVIAHEWKAGKAADPAKLRTMKTVIPRRMAGDGPHVEYIWRNHTSENPHGALRLAAHLLYALGWGVDMAFADVRTPTASGVIYLPGVKGDPLAVPMPGTLDDLRATYSRFVTRSSGLGVDTHTRPSLLRMQKYSNAGNLARPSLVLRLLKPDGFSVKAVRWEHSQRVAAWLRHASAVALVPELGQAEVDRYVQGHTGSGEDKSDRLSYVPLPSIAGPNPRGQVSRVLISEPAGASGEVINLLARKLPGSEVTSPPDGVVTSVLEAAEPNDFTTSLYVASRRSSRVWRSVTPVVLHGFNTTHKGAISVAKTERLLLRAFAMAGWTEDRIARLEFQTGPLWPGCGHAGAIDVPAHLKGYPRVHVQVTFRDDVKGPVLAGIGRHSGLGSFARVLE